MDGNEAAANMAYAVSDVSFIYPITPSTPMGEYFFAAGAARAKHAWPAAVVAAGILLGRVLASWVSHWHLWGRHLIDASDNLGLATQIIKAHPNAHLIWNPGRKPRTPCGTLPPTL